MTSHNNSRGYSLIFVLAAVVVSIVAGLKLFAIPHRGHPSAVEPFNNRNTILLSEKVTFLLRKPQVSDAVIFTPNLTTNAISDFIGVITQVEDKNGIKTYTVYSSYGKPWTLTADKIKERIYYPQIASDQIAKITTNPGIVPNPGSYTTPVGPNDITSPNPWNFCVVTSSKSTPGWSTCENKIYGWKIDYPSNWSIYDKGFSAPSTDGKKIWFDMNGYVQFSPEKLPEEIQEGTDRAISDGFSISANGNYPEDFKTLIADRGFSSVTTPTYPAVTMVNDYRNSEVAQYRVYFIRYLLQYPKDKKKKLEIDFMDKDGDQASIDLFKKIISTFKLTN